MKPRSLSPSPSFVVAVLALVLAASGAGFAAGKITSKQIKDNTITSADIKNGTVRSPDLKNKGVKRADLAKRSVGRDQLARGCRANELALNAMCVKKASSGPSTFEDAVADCASRGGRLPSLSELAEIAREATDGNATWADGNPAQYEYSYTVEEATPHYFIAMDRAGNNFTLNAPQDFRHHCLTPAG